MLLVNLSLKQIKSRFALTTSNLSKCKQQFNNLNFIVGKLCSQTTIRPKCLGIEPKNL